MRAQAPLFATAMLVAFAAFSGCLFSSNDGTGTGDMADSCVEGTLDDAGVNLVPTTFDPINDNRSRALDNETYNFRTCSLPAIGHSDLRPNDPHKYLGEIDMRGDLNIGVVAVLGNGEEPGVYVLDITQRDRPEVLAFIAQPGAYVTDVKISDDGRVLYTASQDIGVDGLPAFPAPVAKVGFTAYNIEDPANPAYLGMIPDAPIGCHMLEAVQVSPTDDAVFCVSNHVRSYLVSRAPGAFYTLGFVEYIPQNNGVPTPSGPLGVDPSCGLPNPAPDLGVCLLSSAPHDMTVFHEGGAFGLGTSYLVVSHWDSGLKVLDITDAPIVAEVGGWNGEGATHYHGNVHTAMMFRVGDDRFIIASPEYTVETANEVPGFWVLDANDLFNLKLVGEWYHPSLHAAQGLFLTTHQWQVAPTGSNVTADDVRIYMTYNHAGVWVLDLGAILRKDDQGAILGFNLARTPIPETHVPYAVLNTWDVNVVDGYIYGSDRATGLWVFHYTGDELGDVRLRGFA